jgi:hypothetical protein
LSGLSEMQYHFIQSINIPYYSPFRSFKATAISRFDTFYRIPRDKSPSLKMYLRTVLSATALLALFTPSLAADCSGRHFDATVTQYWQLRETVCGGGCEFQKGCTKFNGGLKLARWNSDGHVGFGDCWVCIPPLNAEERRILLI